MFLSQHKAQTKPLVVVLNWEGKVYLCNFNKCGVRFNFLMNGQTVLDIDVHSSLKHNSFVIAISNLATKR